MDASSRPPSRPPPLRCAQHLVVAIAGSTTNHSFVCNERRRAGGQAALAVALCFQHSTKHPCGMGPRERAGGRRSPRRRAVKLQPPHGDEVGVLCLGAVVAVDDLHLSTKQKGGELCAPEGEVHARKAGWAQAWAGFPTQDLHAIPSASRCGPRSWRSRTARTRCSRTPSCGRGTCLQKGRGGTLRCGGVHPCKRAVQALQTRRAATPRTPPIQPHSCSLAPSLCRPTHPT